MLRAFLGAFPRYLTVLCNFGKSMYMHSCQWRFVHAVAARAKDNKKIEIHMVSGRTVNTVRREYI